MKITIGYPIAFGCEKFESNAVKHLSQVNFVEANSYNEAVGMAIERARKEFPPSDGYTGHLGIAIHISADRGWFQQKLDESVQESNET